MNPVEQLKSVLCDASGKCCVPGSDEDRAIVDRALQALAQQERKPLSDADVVEQPSTPAPVRTFTFYMDKGGKWRWRCKARNGRTVSVSGESFHNKANAERAALQEASLYGQNAIVLHKAKVGYARRENP